MPNWKLPVFSQCLLMIVLGLSGQSAAGKFLIGAYDAQHWAGLTLVAPDHHGFGFYLEVEKDGARAVGYDIFHIVKEVGPNSGDGQYASLVIDASLPFGLGHQTPILDKSIASETVSLEWTAGGGGRVVGRIVNRSRAFLYLNFYAPWDYRASYVTAEGGITAWSGGWRFAFAAIPGCRLDTPGENVRLKLEPGADGVTCFEACIGRIPLAIKADRREIEDRLAAAAAAYEGRRVRVSGSRDRERLVESITNNLNWMVLVQPEKPALYTPAGRRWIFPGPERQYDFWTLFEWDSFFNALLLAVESPDLAKAALLAVLGTQYPNGCISNWRGPTAGARDRAQPPVGAFAVLKVYRQYGDRDLLARAYPILKKFNLYWTARVATGHARRDGNDNGLLEWGSDKDQLEGWVPEWEVKAEGRVRAAWESGQDDLPNYDGVPYNESTWTLELDCVDQNSLFALDCECLAEMARILGYRADERFFHDRYARTRAQMNRLLWDEKSGTYRDRTWRGELSGKLAAANFFPLIAGIPDEGRARRMLDSLLDPDLFWGEYVVPTINRQDPAFADQQYWRGTIWPPTNYLVYQGLRRYRFWQAAAELAQKSERLFLRTWETYQLCRENYDSRSGEGGGQRYQSWGPLFALMGVEEFISWETDGKLKVGSLGGGPGARLNNISDGRRRFAIEMSDRETALAVNGREILRATAPIVFSGLHWTDKSFSAEVEVARACELRFAARGTRFMTSIDGRRETKTEPVLSLAPGRHRLEVKEAGR